MLSFPLGVFAGRKIKIIQYHLFNYSIIKYFPGTHLWKEVTEKHGFKPPQSLEDWGNYDYNRVNVAYLPEKMRRLLENIYIPSLCMDQKFDDYEMPWWFNLGLMLYKPLAHLRLKNLFYHFPVEKIPASIVENIFTKKTLARTPWTL